MDDGLFKAEVSHRHRASPQATPGEQAAERAAGHSFEAVGRAMPEWADWRDHRRLHEPVGNVPPAETEARCYAQVEMQALAA